MNFIHRIKGSRSWCQKLVSIPLQYHLVAKARNFPYDMCSVIIYILIMVYSSDVEIKHKVSASLIECKGKRRNKVKNQPSLTEKLKKSGVKIKSGQKKAVKEKIIG